MFGTVARSLFLTAFLILAPVVLFCTFISEGLIREFGLHNGIMIVAISSCHHSFDCSSSPPNIRKRSLHNSSKSTSS
ncbi:hypothetical protein MLD38_003367 [Melastoma candidum]|uniref:Uncharacterized protein n=1 Tax=Melastoma candidum TaxID=119954 RepID=A0ACB9SAW9_9MYRT|nr:hypothetical protein MLD38_003367 [Melastoma candidum]